MARVAVRLRVTGLVHGVLFRASMSERASRAQVAGWVRNLPDGSVEALLEGEESDVSALVDWAKRGPPRARVDSVTTEPQAVRGIRGFRVDG